MLHCGFVIRHKNSEEITEDGRFPDLLDRLVILRTVYHGILVADIPHVGFLTAFPGVRGITVQNGAVHEIIVQTVQACVTPVGYVSAEVVPAAICRSEYSSAQDVHEFADLIRRHVAFAIAECGCGSCEIPKRDVRIMSWRNGNIAIVAVFSYDHPHFKIQLIFYLRLINAARIFFADFNNVMSYLVTMFFKKLFHVLFCQAFPLMSILTALVPFGWFAGIVFISSLAFSLAFPRLIC